MLKIHMSTRKNGVHDTSILLHQGVKLSEEKVLSKRDEIYWLPHSKPPKSDLIKVDFELKNLNDNLTVAYVTKNLIS